MSKERLEEIKERVLVDMVYYKYLDGTKGHWGKVYTLSEEDYNYLIERVQESENRIADDEHFVAEILEQNKRYREVINNINEKAMLYGVDEEIYEAIKEAIRALEGHE